MLDLRDLAGRGSGNWWRPGRDCGRRMSGKLLTSPPGPPPCMSTLGSTPKNNIRPRMIRSPTMPMPPPPPPPTRRRSGSARRRRETGSRSPRPRPAGPRRFRSLVAAPAHVLATSSEGRLLPGFCPLCMGRGPAQGLAMGPEPWPATALNPRGRVCAKPRGVKARPQMLVAIKKTDKEPSKNCHRPKACCSCPVVFSLGRVVRSV